MKGSALIVAVTFAGACHKTDDKPAEPACNDPDPWKCPKQHAATRPQQREPSYAAPLNANNERERLLADKAMHVVYDRCSKFTANFKFGASLDGTLVFKDRDTDPDRVNVSVKLAYDQVAEGNVLWYMITFDENGAPKKIRATKDIAGALCDLNSTNWDYDL